MFKAINTNLLIDARMAIEDAMMFAIDPMAKKDVDAYSKTMYSDEDSVHERCTYKATAYTSCLIAGMITKVVKDFVLGNKYVRTMQWSIAGDKQECYHNS